MFGPGPCFAGSTGSIWRLQLFLIEDPDLPSSSRSAHADASPAPAADDNKISVDTSSRARALPSRRGITRQHPGALSPDAE